jgi:peptidoglycan hydrolase CwlO-like protein
MLVSLVLSALVVSPVLADSQSTTTKLQNAKGKIGDTQADLDAAEARLNELVGRIGTEQKSVDALQVQTNALAATMDGLASQIAQTQGQVVEKQAEIQEAQQQLDSTQGQLNERAKIAYENGPGGSIEFLLGSTSLGDLTDRLEIMNHAAQSDQDIIDRIRGQQEHLEIRKREAFDLEKKLRAKQDDLLVQQNDLTSRFEVQQTALIQLGLDRNEAESIVSQLRAKKQKETEVVKRLEAELAREQAARIGGGATAGGVPGSGPTLIAGVLLVCPVDQPHAYSDEFGAPRYAGGYHPHAGNDILAPTGTPIRATFDGTAVDATNGLGGLAVKVYGADGWTYNAHLSAFGKLGSVKTGTVIGYVGASGDAAGGPSHDHFEWHPTVIPSNLRVSGYGYSIINGAIDPWPYLNSVC